MGTVKMQRPLEQRKNLPRAARGSKMSRARVLRYEEKQLCVLLQNAEHVIYITRTCHPSLGSARERLYVPFMFLRAHYAGMAFIRRLEATRENDSYHKQR